MSKARFLSTASWRKLRSIVSDTSRKETSPSEIVIIPASIFDRSRMSLISVSRSCPDEWIVLANSVCLSLRFPSGLSDSSLARISSEFSGVRSSCDMLAMNSLLYFDVTAS